MSSELLYRIALTCLPGVGDITAKKLVVCCGSAEAVFREKKSILLKVPDLLHPVEDLFHLQKEILLRAEEELAFCQKYGIRVLFYTDADYPMRLKQCNDGPILLFVKGNTDLNAPRILSMVGTRSSTEYGRKICYEILRDLAPLGVLIVSGLAYGIDAESHEAALYEGLDTVAVLGHGLDRIYPQLHKPLAEKIIHQGCLLTEFISKSNPDRENFPKRNRIVAGLADATLVVEAGKKGGALITASIADSYNRDVFAVPGRTTDAFSAGCNHLIKIQKAVLVETAADIMYQTGWDPGKKEQGRQKVLFRALNTDEKNVVRLLKEKKELDVDEICFFSGLLPGKVAEALLNMEFDDIIISLPGKHYRLNEHLLFDELPGAEG